VGQGQQGDRRRQHQPRSFFRRMAAPAARRGAASRPRKEAGGGGAGAGAGRAARGGGTTGSSIPESPPLRIARSAPGAAEGPAGPPTHSPTKNGLNRTAVAQAGHAATRPGAAGTVHAAAAGPGEDLRSRPRTARGGTDRRAHQGQQKVGPGSRRPSSG